MTGTMVQSTASSPRTFFPPSRTCVLSMQAGWSKLRKSIEPATDSCDRSERRILLWLVHLRFEVTFMHLKRASSVSSLQLPLIAEQGRGCISQLQRVPSPFSEEWKFSLLHCALGDCNTRACHKREDGLCGCLSLGGQILQEFARCGTLPAAPFCVLSPGQRWSTRGWDG